MADVIGLLLFVVYMAAIISLAAGVTLLVVRLSPGKKPKPDAAAEA
jgi:hypothetical protein